MSRINAVRIINLNYNNNLNLVSDETFLMNGVNTLMTMDNGGGKSVLIQMMIAPFVHKQYRLLNKRPFESFFTSSKPTFVLVEWMLDHGAGYVLTGMMVRKNQDPEDANALEHLQFIAEYREACIYDIHRLEVVEKEHGKSTLKGFGTCRQMFEEYRKDRSKDFYLYDMNQQAQAKQYFDRLREYRIDSSEWESVIYRINRGEAGLAELFAKCRNEKELVEEWFLGSVDEKLNRESKRIKGFQSILEKQAGQFRNNRAKLESRDTILAFLEELKGVQNSTAEYLNSDGDKTECAGRIGAYKTALKGLQGQEENKRDTAEMRQHALAEELHRLEWGKLSAEIYGILREIEQTGAYIGLLQAELDSIERKMSDTKRELAVQECARLQEKTDGARREYELAKERLRILLEKSGDLEPERRTLGGGLKAWYAEKLRVLETQENTLREENEHRAAEKEQKELQKAELQKKKDQLSKTCGALEAAVRAFDETEERMNRRYDMSWQRNIVGMYEEGALTIAADAYAKELEETERECKKQLKKRQEIREEQRASEHKLEEALKKEAELKQTGERLKEQQERLEKEKAQREKLIRLFGLSPEAVFDKEKLAETIKRRMEESDRDRSGCVERQHILEERVRRLKAGRMTEIEPAFLELLEREGISYVYGSEWLKKNGRKERENRELAAAHPFLPYALIVSSTDLERLQKCEDPVACASPVPLILREELEAEKTAENAAVICFPGVSFYLWFDERLLSERKLTEYIGELEKETETYRSRILQRNEEYREYAARLAELEAQRLDAAVWKQSGEAVAENVQQRQEAEGLVQKIRERRTELEKEDEGIRVQLAAAEEALGEMRRRAEEFAAFTLAYDAYQEHLEELDAKRKEAEQTAQKLELNERRLRELAELEMESLSRRHRIESEKKENEKSFHIYEAYEACAADWSEEEKILKEARFEAITREIGVEQKLLEEQEQMAAARLSEAEKEQKRRAQKSGLQPAEWAGVRYDAARCEQLEEILERIKNEAEQKKAECNRKEKQLAVLEDRRERGFVKLKGELGEEELLAEEEIKDRNPEEEIALKKQEQKDLIAQLHRIEKRLAAVRSNLDALAEYEDTESAEGFAADPGEWSDEELSEHQAQLRKEYRRLSEICERKRRHLEKLLEDLLADERFAQEEYRKSVQALRSQTEQPAETARQLETSIAAYTAGLDKLMVDIELIEREKEEIVGMLTDYISEVHEQLGRIDANSTIHLREKPVKMLRIILPVWEENEALYRQRVGDFIDEVLGNCVALLEENKPIQEFIGSRITTRVLYNAVVGSANVQIRLNKIEKEREYPISWADVSRNSGGEGFLSAFVVLSALMYYARREETDLFSEKNESKVLIMDNPFATTNASHLLIPMMEVAKKSNVQLICLTGLGGNSIYDRFNNIYTMELVSSNLRGGMQYLKSRHVRGSDEKTMLTARVEVLEQLSFLTEDV